MAAPETPAPMMATSYTDAGQVSLQTPMAESMGSVKAMPLPFPWEQSRILSRTSMASAAWLSVITEKIMLLRGLAERKTLRMPGEQRHVLDDVAHADGVHHRGAGDARPR